MQTSIIEAPSELMVNIVGYSFLAVMTVLTLFVIFRSKRGPKRFHELAARIAARHGGHVRKGPWGRPVVEITRTPLRFEIAWWHGHIGRYRRGPLTWITMGPTDPNAAPAYPELLAVGRHRGGYAKDISFRYLDVDLGDPELKRVLRIHAQSPAALAAFLGPAARARMLQRPEWETTGLRDGAPGADEEAPTASLLRVMIPGHVEDEAELDAALGLLEDLAHGR